jgi:hypothetical protein
MKRNWGIRAIMIDMNVKLDTGLLQMKCNVDTFIMSW